MTNLSRYLILSISLLVPTLAFSETQVITLKDGSQIKGELVGVANGAYTIKTPLLGEVHINSGQVVNIASASAVAVQPIATAPVGQPAQAASNTDINQKMAVMQTKLMSNPEFVADLQKMAQDPELMKILSDPELLQAVTSKDVNAIQSNPRTQQLLQNPKVKALIDKLHDSGMAK